MKIYKIDSSKLIKIGEPGYIKGQEQAKTYFKTIPKSDHFDVEIEEKTIINKIFEIAKITEGLNSEPILINIDNTDVNIAMTIYYMEGNTTCSCMVISHKNCDAESNYNLATDILNYIKVIKKY